MVRAVLVLCLVSTASAASGSAIQKVVELLDECKAKVQKDLDAEAKAMEEYTSFCDEELTQKGYAIKTAERTINELSADIADGEATSSALEDEIAMVGSELAAKDKELAAASATRATEQEGFKASEKEMIESVEELAGAIGQLKGGAAFLQG